MKNLVNSLLVKIGLRNDVGAPVHAGVNPVYFTDVYPTPNGTGFTFSWRSADHAQGMVRDDFSTAADAETARTFWQTRRGQTEHATFVSE